MNDSVALFRDIPSEFLTREFKAVRIFSKGGKPLGTADVVLCRNGVAYWVKRGMFCAGRLLDEGYEGVEGA